MPDIFTPSAIFTVGGPTHRIKVGRKVYTFEDHPKCGPIAVKKNGDSLRRQPAAFLRAVTVWYHRGKRINPLGFCIWRNADEAHG